MAADVFLGQNKIGRVSTSGEVYYQGEKVGWANGNGAVYLNGIPYGWISIGGSVLDRRDINIGYVDREGNVYRGNQCIGRVDNPTSRYDTGGAALLLLLGRFAKERDQAGQAATAQENPATAYAR